MSGARKALLALAVFCYLGVAFAIHAQADFGPAQGAAGGSSDAELTAIGALTPTDGNVIVGDGSTWVAESGATARTSLGLGTGDSPTFTGVTATTVTATSLDRSNAGALALGGTNATSVVVRGAATFDSNGRLTLPNGTSGTPSIVGGDADSGVYLNGATTSFYSNNNNLFEVTPTSGLCVGATAINFGNSNGGQRRHRTLTGANVSLTDATATTVMASISAVSNTSVGIGGTIDATITASDGTDFQAIRQTITYVVVNKGGVYTTDIDVVTNSSACSTGTLTATWDITTGSNLFNVRCTADTSLTPTSMRVRYGMDRNDQGAD